MQVSHREFNRGEEQSRDSAEYYQKNTSPGEAHHDFTHEIQAYSD